MTELDEELDRGILGSGEGRPEGIRVRPHWGAPGPVTREDRRLCARAGHEPKTTGSGAVVCARCGEACEWPKVTVSASPFPAPSGEVEVTIAPKVMGRVTGWVVVCSEHGAADEARPSEVTAMAFGMVHLEDYHRGAGRIRTVREEAPIGRRRRRGRRRGA